MFLYVLLSVGWDGMGGEVQEQYSFKILAQMIIFILPGAYSQIRSKMTKSSWGIVGFGRTNSQLEASDTYAIAPPAKAKQGRTWLHKTTRVEM